MEWQVVYIQSTGGTWQFNSTTVRLLHPFVLTKYEYQTSTKLKTCQKKRLLLNERGRPSLFPPPRTWQLLVTCQSNTRIHKYVICFKWHICGVKKIYLFKTDTCYTVVQCVLISILTGCTILYTVVTSPLRWLDCHQISGVACNLCHFL